MSQGFGFNHYQKESKATAIYPTGRDYLHPDADIDLIIRLCYLNSKLPGETGEVTELIGKWLRDDKGEPAKLPKEKLAKELGDVLWYIAQYATELDVQLGEVAYKNLVKLLDRQRRGVLGGSGDER